MGAVQRPSEARYAFVVNWYDTAACIIREYQLVFYEADGTIEMVRAQPSPPTWLSYSDVDLCACACSALGNDMVLLQRSGPLGDEQPPVSC